LTRPLALTMGDPAGIGPEIVVSALTTASDHAPGPVVILGDLGRLRDAAAILGVDVAVVAAPGSWDELDPCVLSVVQIGELPPNLPFGEVDGRAGAASFAYFSEGVALALQGRVAAVVTAPIQKEAWQAGGVPFPDHTSALVELTRAERHAMMLANDELSTVLVTTHLALKDAIGALTQQRIRATIVIAHDEMRSRGIAEPRIAVAALNPHAGEGGMFGDEEIRLIGPAIEATRAAGIQASGPYPADTVFMRARRGEFDVVISQYHDQGLIPIKLLGIENGVNVTLGLPIVRTSVDHGTAMDIAGTGTASGKSLQYAITAARRIVDAKTRTLQTRGAR
jgi:4-hydroxythreonine-4-phosphate dehydrogenase